MQKIRHDADLGRNLRTLRIAAGLTQEQVAIKMQLRGCDISRSIYAQMESGSYNIRIPELRALKEIFGATWEQMLDPVKDDTEA